MFIDRNHPLQLAICLMWPVISMSMPLYTSDKKNVDAFFVMDGKTLVACAPSSRGVVTVPVGTEVIGDEAFKGCGGVTGVILPFGVVNIGEDAFLGCGLKEIFLPESITNIGNGAFSICPSLSEVVLPYGLTDISHGCFAQCLGLKRVRIPASVTNIHETAFASCSNLEDVNLPRGLRRIGHAAFRCCRRLELSRVPTSLEYIGEYAFCGCSRLESLTFPAGNIELHGYAFAYCLKLKELRFEGDAPKVNDFSSVLSYTREDLKVMVNAGSKGWEIEGGGWPMDVPADRREVVVISDEVFDGRPSDKTGQIKSDCNRCMISDDE